MFLTARRDGRDHVKLLDFGIDKAAHHSALTGTGAALGTPFYMSPEQILAEPLDPRTDIYSLGVVFFEALAGRLPFEGEPLQVAMQHCNVPAPRLATLVPDADIPAELDALVDSMLAKSRDARPQSMEAIETYLREFLAAHSAGTLPRPGAAPIPGLGGDASQLVANLSPTPPTGIQPLATLESALDPALAPPRLRPIVLVPILAALALLAVILALVLRGDEPAPTVAAAPTVVTPVAPPPAPKPVPSDSDPAPLDQPASTSEAPAASDSDAADADDEPVPSDSSVGDAATVRKPVPVKSTSKPADPLKQIRRLAEACRKQHKAVKGPKITVDYATASDGSVTRAVPATADPLGRCLAAAVKAATFPPKLKLGQKIDL